MAGSKNRKSKNNGLRVGVIAGATMIFFAGCAREGKIDYYIIGEDLEAVQTDSGIRKSSVSQFADESVWNESWTIIGENDKAIDVRVEAEIYLPEADEMSVVEVVVPQFDAEWKECIVKAVFGDEETTHISENVKLLPLSIIQEIMKEQLNEIYRFNPNPSSIKDRTKLIYNCMELIYFRVKDTQDSEYYSYIPVWRLGEYSVDQSGVMNREELWNPVLVNAIDGSPLAWDE